MKVLLLGATGVSGRTPAVLLAREKQITEIGIASRRLAAAQKAAAEISDKGRAVCVDIHDLPRLASIAAEYDIIVNTAGPTSEVQVPAIQAAIEAGVDYCDLGVNGRPAEKALVLDAKAQAKGVTAIICTGWCAVTGLMAVHAFHQLDKVDDVSTCMQFDYSPGGFFSAEKVLARAKEQNHVDNSGVDLMETAVAPVCTYRNGRPMRIEPIANPIQYEHPLGGTITAYPNDSVESVTLPRYLPGVNNYSSSVILFPPPLNELYIQLGQQIASDESDPAGALVSFYEAILEDKDRWLVNPSGFPGGWWMWAVATGYKNGRKARYFCWPSMYLDWTSTGLIITALRILNGDVAMHGVFPPEACFELGSFFEEAVQFVPEEHRDKALLHERFDWLG